eukprot:355514-Chlamydomonas_euryale.AAC.2
MRPIFWGFSNTKGASLHAIPPSLPVLGVFHCRGSNLRPRDQCTAASQLEKVLKSDATTGAFLMAPRDCRAAHP